MRRSQLMLWSCLLALSACPPGAGQSDVGVTTPGVFYAPQGIAATSRYVLVVSAAFHFEAGRPAFAPGWLTAIDRGSRRVVAKLPVSGVNPQYLAVFGERAYVVSSGSLVSDGTELLLAGGDGALDVFDFSAGPPGGPTASLTLPRNDSDPRIGAYGGITISPDGRRAFIGSGTRGDLFVVELEGELRLSHGPQDPLELFATAPGKNGLTTPSLAGEQLAVIDFNSDGLCLLGDLGGSLGQRRCGSAGAYAYLLEGPIDLARGPSNELLVLMNLTNHLYRLDPRTQPFAVEAEFAKTGLSPNRVLVHRGKAYVVNSMSNNLQRVDLDSGRSDLPFAVFPVGSNPYDLCITEESDGKRGWVTLHASHQVALVDLDSGALLEILPSTNSGDASRLAADGGRSRDAGTGDVRRCSADDGTAVVGIDKVVEVQIGQGGGDGQDRLPGVIQGPPGAGSGDTLSLGEGGQIVVDFGDYDIVDGPGPDFIVFENPFLVASYQPYAEPARVAVSQDAVTPTSFVEFACDLSSSGDPQQAVWPYPGCAGVRPVLAGRGRCVASNDAAVAGGDAFDLAKLGLARARYVRLRDAGLSTMGEANHTAGFDLDAIVLINYTKR